jgi:O-succinylbenzoate synthase
MRIDSIEIYHVAMPLVYPFRTAFGNDDTIESLLVKLVSGDHYGWGESAPWQYPAYSAEFAEGQFLLSKKIITRSLIGKDISTGKQLQQELSWIKGNFFAKAGFDLAWWDLYAKMQNKPLWQVIGGKSPDVEAGADFGIMENIPLLIKTMEKAVAEGYKRVKLKYRPGWELDMISAVRKAFPDLVMHVDCNSAYTLADIEMLKQLDKYNLAMIEQPLMNDDLVDHAVLQAQIKTPVCLDESITSPARARKAIQMKACGWINIKPGRVGGITNAVEIHDIAAAAGIPCWIGGMLESALGANFCIALATLPNIKYPCDVFPTSRFYKKDLSVPETVHSAPSMFKARNVPGVGAEPDPEMLSRETLNQAVFKR